MQAIKKSILILSILFISTSLKAQVNDSAFLFLDKTEINTGILYDKANHLSSLENYNGFNDSICTFSNWKQMYYEIYNAQFQKSLNVPSLQNVIDLKNIFSNSKNDAVPLTIMNFNYNKIKAFAIDSNLIGINNGKYFDVSNRTESPYEEKRVFAFTAYMEKLTFPTVDFYIGK